jgi:MFS superfamily sulfate permease-like transporter
VKLGRLSNYIPFSVIKGMLAGIGLILIIKQIPHLVGYDKDPEGDFEFVQIDGHNTLSDLYYMFSALTPGSIIIGLISMLIIKLADTAYYKKIRYLSGVPGPLLAVAVGMLLSFVFDFIPQLWIDPEHLVNIPRVDSVDTISQNLSLPDFSLLHERKFWIVVVTLGVVASLESLLSLEATDKLDPNKRSSDSNRELIAQGTANMVCGMLGGLPVTAVIVRSSANINAGAKTKLSTYVHAVLIALSLIFFPGLLNRIPNSSLAAILIITGYRLSSFTIFKDLMRKGNKQFMPFIVTIVVMLFTDLLKGVGAGMVVALYFIIRDNVNSSFKVGKETIHGKIHYLVKLPQHLTFLNKGFLVRLFSEIEYGSMVFIDGSINNKVDDDAREVIKEFYENADRREIEIGLTNYTI